MKSFLIPRSKSRVMATFKSLKNVLNFKHFAGIIVAINLDPAK